MQLSSRQLAVLIALTLIWGLNWPIMKAGVTAWPPLTFRALSMWLGLPVLLLALRLLRVPLGVPRRQWTELARLTVTNMLVWHVFAILAVQALSSGRAAILGYTMPVFSALWGRALYGQRLAPRQSAGVVAAAVWALGTQQLRHTRMTVSTLAIAFWMTVATTLVMTVLAVAIERPQWRAPDATVWAAVLYNAALVFGYAQPAWFYLARTLPPIASTLSVMFIPVLGVVAGALWLGETLHWQDFAAIALMVVAIASVLWPGRGSPRPAVEIE